MAKKKSGVKKKVVSRRKSPIKRASVKNNSPRGFDDKTKTLLVENFVGLQKVVIDLAARMDSLTANMTKLLSLFESSAEALVKKNFEIEGIKKKKPFMKEDVSNVSFEREKSFGSNNLLSRPNNIPEFQRMPSNVQNPSYPAQVLQNNQMNYGNNFQNENVGFSRGQTNFDSSAGQVEAGNSFNSNQRGFDNFGQNNPERGSEGLPSLPNTSSGGEIPGSGEGV